MINKLTLKRFACLSAVAVSLVLLSGTLSETIAQRDPFRKPGWATPRKVSTGSSSPAKSSNSTPKVPVNYGPPSVESRIEYYKRLRAEAVANDAPLPKVTSVLTLGEMSVTGIFKTPRGYAAMVEATPIKLSYTIYPGEKFFDGQLVAVEENRLVFRKVTKTGPNKFVSSVENMRLREFSTKAQIEGTAPVQTQNRPTEIASSGTEAKGDQPTKAATPTVFLSPLDEMNNQPSESSDSDKGKSQKSSKKPTKIAKKGSQ